MSESININSFTVQKKIGNGSFANVFKILEKSSGKYYAAKILTTKYDQLTVEARKDLKREINIMTKLNHRGVIKFFGFSPFDFRRKRYPMIIMEYLPNKTLTDVMNLERSSNSPQSWDSTKKLINIYGIASAMSYLHENNIIHRDLKPDNILMDEYLFPRIADFGLSKLTNTTQSLAYKGTPVYSPPEVLLTYSYSFASDVYAYGLIIYEILTSQIPFHGLILPELYAKLVTNQRPEIDKTVPNSYKNLIEKCWAQNPQDRPSFKQIVDLLENNEEFITSDIDKTEFLNYVDYVNLPQASTFANPMDSVSIDRYMSQNSFVFNPVNLGFDDNNPSQKIEETQPEEEDAFEELDDFESGNNLSKGEIAMLYKKSADKGNLYAMVKYGEMLFNGEGVPENKEEAVEYFKMASDFGNLEGMTNYAISLLTGQGISENQHKAVKLFKKASYKGNLRATVKYADSLFNGIGIEKNKEKANQMYKRAAEKGELEAIIKYGNNLYKGDGISTDKQKAIEMFQKAADKGDIDSMFLYGTIMYKGVDVQENKSEAARYFKMAADLGHLKSIMNIALMLNKGEGVTKDVNESIRYYKMAIDKGDYEGMNNYAQILFNEYQQYLEKKNQKEHSDVDENVDSNVDDDNNSDESSESFYNKLNEAERLFEMAADNGNLNAINNYATFLHMFEIDKEKEAHLYRMAAIGGHADAMNNYANILMEGNEFVQKDENAAIQFYKKSADKGHKFAAYNYALILEKNNCTDRDTIKKYFKIAADKHNKYAEYHYGRYLLQENRTEEAMNFFKMAADDGHSDAAFLYGKNQYFGETENSDVKKGMSYIQKNYGKKQDNLLLLISYYKSCNIA